MADFNINALGAFRNVDFGNADAIVNIKQGGGVEQNGKLGNFFCKMFRSSATEANNNAPPDKSEALLYGVIDALNQGDEKLNASENTKLATRQPPHLYKSGGKRQEGHAAHGGGGRGS